MIALWVEGSREGIQRKGFGTWSTATMFNLRESIVVMKNWTVSPTALAVLPDDSLHYLLNLETPQLLRRLDSEPEKAFAQV